MKVSGKSVIMHRLTNLYGGGGGITDTLFGFSLSLHIRLDKIAERLCRESLMQFAFCNQTGFIYLVYHCCCYLVYLLSVLFPTVCSSCLLF